MHTDAQFQYVLASIQACSCAHVQHPPHTAHCANCLVFTQRFLPLSVKQGTINRGHFLRRVDVLSRRMCRKRVMGARDSVPGQRQRIPQAFMSGNLYMPPKYYTVCKCVMYTQAPECNKEIST